MRNLPALAAAAAFLVADAPAAAADLSGAWTLKADFGPKLKYMLVCALAANGGSLSGPCIAVTGPVLKANGRQSPDKIRFGYDTDYNGSGLHLDYSGAIGAGGGAAAGSVVNRLSTGQFRGELLLSPPAAPATATWRFDVAFEPPIAYGVICTFRSTGERIAGPCAVTQGPTLQASGKSDGASITLAYDTEFEGKPVHVEYDGALQPDGSIRGAARAGDGAGVFTATRQ